MSKFKGQIQESFPNYEKAAKDFYKMSNKKFNAAVIRWIKDSPHKKNTTNG